MQFNPSLPVQTTAKQPQPLASELKTAPPKIERKPGEPFDVRKADIQIQAKWVLSDISQTH